MTAEAVRGGNRRYLVALSLLLTAAGLAIPFVQSLAAIIVLVTIAVSFAHVGPATNGALVSDLLRSPGDAGRAFAFLVLGGNTFGLLAPIVTGYIVAATGSFDSAFIAWRVRWRSSGRRRHWYWRAARSASTSGRTSRDRVWPTDVTGLKCRLHTAPIREEGAICCSASTVAPPEIS